jgi:predicted permease
MSAWKMIWYRIRSLFNRGRSEGEISDEMQFHLQLLINYYIAEGYSPDEARSAAKRRFGNLRSFNYQCQEISVGKRGNLMNGFAQNIIYGFRLFVKHRGFTAVAVLSLALGIGVNTAMFSFVDGVLLKPLDYQDSDRLVTVWDADPTGPHTALVPSPPAFFDWREQNTVFSSMAAYSSNDYSGGGEQDLTVGGTTQKIKAATASANYFDTMGIQPVLGRGFEQGEDQNGKSQVAVLTNHLWHNAFGADPNILGKTIKLNNDIFTIIGVLPAKTVLDRAEIDICLPMVVKPSQMTYRNSYFTVYARIKPGVTLQQASENMKQVAQNLDAQGRTAKKGRTVNLLPLRDFVVKTKLRKTLLLLMATVLFILLIACLNVANLLLARGAARQREVVIRAALGASRWQLIQQLMIESLMLSGFGGAIGLLLSYWLIAGLTSLMPPATIPAEARVGIDYRVLAFTLGLAFATGMVCGLLPAAQTTKLDLARLLQERDLGTSTLFRRNKSRSLLLISEIALCFILVISATLMIRSFSTLLNVDAGFKWDKILTAQTVLSKQRFAQGHQILAYETELLNRVRALPGVKAAGLTNSLPIVENRNKYINGISIIRNIPGKSQKADSAFEVVTPDYFAAMGINPVKGRLLSVIDTAQNQPVAVINQTLALDAFGDQDPIGQEITIGSVTGSSFLIVGVAKDVRHDSLDSHADPEVYASLYQLSDTDVIHYVRSPVFAIRTDGDPMKLASTLQSLAGDINKEQPLDHIQTMDRVISDSVVEPRFNTVIFTGFGMLALILAAIGIYGVMSYSVNQRVKEIGIRMSLGAQRTDIFRLVVGRGLGLASIGVSIGAAGAFYLTKYLETLLFEIKGTDPVTFVSVGALMIAVAILACYLPARRATKVDPMITLRYE